MKTALFSALLVLSSVATLGLTAKQGASDSIDQIRSEEMVAPGDEKTPRGFDSAKDDLPPLLV